MQTVIHLSDAKELPGRAARFLALALMEAAGDNEGVTRLLGGDVSISAPEDSPLIMETEEKQSPAYSDEDLEDPAPSETEEQAVSPAQAFAVVAPPTPPPTEGGVEEVDVNGEVWNPDFHSTPATKNKDGSWRVRRNSGKAPPRSGPSLPAPVRAAPPPPPPPATEPLAGDAPDFQGLMRLNQDLLTRGKVTPTTIYDICAAQGFSLPEAAQDAAKRATLFAHLNAFAG